MDHDDQRHRTAGIQPLGDVQQVATPSFSAPQLAIGAEEDAQPADQTEEPERERGRPQGERSGKPEGQ